jgi:hypothetical protein
LVPWLLVAGGLGVAITAIGTRLATREPETDLPDVEHVDSA